MIYVVLIIGPSGVILLRTIKVIENEKHTDHQRRTTLRAFRRAL